MNTKAQRHGRPLKVNNRDQRSAAKGRIVKRAIAGIGTVGILIGIVATVIDHWDKLHPPPANVIIEHDWSYSHALEPDLKSIVATLDWEMGFTITNLESRSIAIVAVDPHFPALNYAGHIWTLSPDGGSLIQGREFSSQAALHEYYYPPDSDGKHDGKEITQDWPEEQPPFIIKAGQKTYFAFELWLRIYRDGKQCDAENKCELSDDPQFLAPLLGGRLDSAGHGQWAKRDVPFTIRLDDGRTVNGSFLCYIAVPGWIGPNLVKESDGTLSIE